VELGERVVELPGVGSRQGAVESDVGGVGRQLRGAVEGLQRFGGSACAQVALCAEEMGRDAQGVAPASGGL